MLRVGWVAHRGHIYLKMILMGPLLEDLHMLNPQKRGDRHLINPYIGLMVVVREVLTTIKDRLFHPNPWDTTNINIGVRVPPALNRGQAPRTWLAPPRFRVFIIILANPTMKGMGLTYYMVRYTTYNILHIIIEEIMIMNIMLTLIIVFFPLHDRSWG